MPTLAYTPGIIDEIEAAATRDTITEINRIMRELAGALPLSAVRRMQERIAILERRALVLDARAEIERSRARLTNGEGMR